MSAIPQWLSLVARRSSSRNRRPSSRYLPPARCLRLEQLEERYLLSIGLSDRSRQPDDASIQFMTRARPLLAVLRPADLPATARWRTIRLRSPVLRWPAAVSLHRARSPRSVTQPSRCLRRTWTSTWTWPRPQTSARSLVRERWQTGVQQARDLLDRRSPAARAGTRRR